MRVRASGWDADDGSAIRAGGAAQVVAWIGHNRWMDRDDFDWAKFRKHAAPDAQPKGTIAVACKTEEYLADEVVSGRRVPLALLP